jgi:FkbM family methyltransferase
MSPPLDVSLDRIESSNTKLRELVSEMEKILETLVTNDTEILEALTQILLVVPQMQARNEQNQAKLVEEIRKQIRSFTLELVEKSSSRTNRKSSILVEANPFSAANPEIGLVQHLYSFLPTPIALDVGANIGDFSRGLLQAGYEVYAFEPNPPVFETLRRNLGGENRFRAFQFALGSTDATMSLQVAIDPTGGNKYGDPSLFSSLVEHPMPEDLPFSQSVPVLVRTVETLREACEIPPSAGLIKIDTEGFDLEVIRGLGEDESPIVMAEFWDATHWFGRSGKGRLEDLVKEMKTRGYNWYVVIYHQEDTSTISYYCNRFQTVPNTWGNVLFFRDHAIFAHAYSWCENTMIQTLYC